MTREHKEHKIKLIRLIMIVNIEYARRKPFNNTWEMVSFVYENAWWATELKRVLAHKTFEVGCIYTNQTKREIP